MNQILISTNAGHSKNIDSFLGEYEFKLMMKLKTFALKCQDHRIVYKSIS